MAWFVQRDGLALLWCNNMLDAIRDFDDEIGLALRETFNGRLSVLARQAVAVWSDREKLDSLLAGYVGVLKDCELLYAIDANGRQVSSNVHIDSIDSGAFGQDLSHRPFAIDLDVLCNPALGGTFSCSSYISQATRREVITLMHSVVSESDTLGFIAADFYPESILVEGSWPRFTGASSTST